MVDLRIIEEQARIVHQIKLTTQHLRCMSPNNVEGIGPYGGELHIKLMMIKEYEIKEKGA